MRSHTGERPFQCNHCSYASTDTFKLKRHKRIHTGEKPYECKICNKMFNQHGSWKDHESTHSKEKQLVVSCESCPTTFNRNISLYHHVQNLHVSDKPVQCAICGNSFTYKNTLKVPKWTHRGESASNVHSAI